MDHPIKLYVWASFFTIINSSIMRLPCLSYANFNLIPNYYYIGDIESTYIASSIFDCGTYCVRSPSCVFANYNKVQHTCELMSSLANSSNSSTNQEWQIGPVCENNTPCDNLYCRDVCTSDTLAHAYLCLATNDVSRIGTPSLSTTYSPSTAASNAIDGNVFITAVTHFSDNNKWFKLDLKFIFRINQIIVWNSSTRSSRMNGNKLFLGITDKATDYSQIAVLSSNLKQTFSGSFIARYIFINNTVADALQVAEINVFV
ncbi:uncharacterized protein LOC124810248 isoform X2 [Hydra vulgaris]|uniref:uncharacterized protein LOC124810248 isoform X2 n=1 Tax=Hydra vulgaris TaxID=6087 RepID=UPI001F5F59B1|nr:uncharacterized protein LOC124810248 isoform X2 [Hydra vulgaris]